MTLYEIIISRRSIRQFKPQPVPRDLLEKMVNAARLAPSAANRQPLEFVVVDDPGKTREIHPCLKWAASIAPQGNPKPGHEPTAFIVTLANIQVRDKGFEWDAGAAVQNMILVAWSEGVGSCWIVSVDKPRLREILGIPDSRIVDSVLALGYPDEQPAVEDLVDSAAYWKDSEGRLHVPKRRLESIIHVNGF